MDIESIRRFIEVARVGSFNGAAKNLFISQQGLNRSITALEDLLGVDLIERHSGGVRLTPEGTLFLDYAKDSVHGFDDMVTSIAETRIARKVATSERLNIVSTPYFTAVSIPIAGVSEGLHNFVEMPFGKLMKTIHDSRSNDLYLVDAFPENLARIREDETLVFEPFFKTQMGVIAHKSFQLPESGGISCAEVAAFLVAYTSDSTNAGIVASLFDSTPLQNACLQSTNAGMLIDWVTAGRAVSLFDSFAYHMLSRNDDWTGHSVISFIPFIDEGTTDTTGFLYRADAGPTQAMRETIENTRLMLFHRFPNYMRVHGF